MSKATKKFLSILLVILMVITAFPFTALAASNTDPDTGLKYEITDDTVRIVKQATSLTGNIAIPESINGYPVTAIDSYAFANNKNITGVIIPEGVTKIENFTFYKCKKLKSVEIPYGVEYLGNSSFSGCTSLKSVVLPETVEATGGCVFFGCTSLKTVNIPASLRQLNNGDFANCTSLESIALHKDFERIEDSSVFAGCSALKEITVEEGNEYFCTDEFGTLFNIDKTEVIFIPAGSEKNTFYVPATVDYFDHTMLKGIASIEKVEVEEGNPAYASDEYGALYNADKTELLYYPAGSKNAEYVMPDSVYTMAEGVFKKAANLKNIKLSESLTAVSYEAMAFCNSLETVEIPASVTTIDKFAFLGSANLKKVVLSEGVEYIAPGAFAMCPALESVAIPASVTYIGGEAFYTGDIANAVTIFYAGDEAAWNNIEIEDQSYEFEEVYHEFFGVPESAFTTFPEEIIMHYNCTSHDDAARILIEEKSTKATCIENGAEYYVCAFCDYEYDVVVTDKAAHIMGDWEIVPEPTCYSVGEKVRKCTLEGCDHEEKETIAVVHEYAVDEVVPATCTENGYTVYKCALCGDTYTDNIITAAGHNDNNSDHYCDVCGETVSDHTWVIVSEKYTTCTENGEFISVCSVCGKEMVEIIDAVGHVYMEFYADRPATCADPTEKECIFCGHIESIERAPHAFDDGVVVEPTCTENGYTVYTCTVCGEVVIADEVDALGHIDNDDDNICDDCGEKLADTADDLTETDDTFRCSFCDKYEAHKDSSFVGFFYKIIHFFMHNIFRVGRTA